MAKTIQITLSSDPARLIENIKNMAGQNGIDFRGDHHAGTFSGNGVEGEYSIHGNLLSLNILKKPLIIPWTMVESIIRKFVIVQPQLEIL